MSPQGRFGPAWEGSEGAQRMHMRAMHRNAQTTGVGDVHFAAQGHCTVPATAAVQLEPAVDEGNRNRGKQTRHGPGQTPTWPAQLDCEKKITPSA